MTAGSTTQLGRAQDKLWLAGRRAAVFDCDGLLLDTWPLWRNSFDSAAAVVGCRLSDDCYAALLGSSVSTAAALIAQWAHDPASTLDLESVIRETLRESSVTHRPVVLPGARELLDHLKSRVPVAVASNAPAEVLAQILAQSKLLDVFAAVVSAEDTDHPKPAPDVYLAACRALNVEPGNAIGLEDSLAGAEAAQSAGLSVIVTTSGTWPSRTPLAWPAQSRPILFVTTLADPAVLAHIVGGEHLLAL